MKQEVTILIVDDQVINLKILFRLLTNHKFRVIIADSGHRALKILENLSPDVILLDVMMPGIDGFETCRQIKNNEKTTDIPVIFITALNSIEDKITGFEVGGVDYITKPFHKLEVLARINAHIMILRQRQELEHALKEIKRLSGILPICSFCKKIRDDDGYWLQVEQYVAEHSNAMFSHGLCPGCMEEHYSDVF